MWLLEYVSVMIVNNALASLGISFCAHFTHDFKYNSIAKTEQQTGLDK